MPTFNYYCKTCEHTFSEFKKSSAGNEGLFGSCPLCDNEKAMKQFTAPENFSQIVVKGKGAYKNEIPK